MAEERAYKDLWEHIEELDKADAHPYGKRPFERQNYIKKFITHIAPCIEVVGYRQKKKGIKSLGDLCSDYLKNKNIIKNLKKINF